jgi:phosphoribosylaminoimidazole carboxylase (NCAIR synthetase)
MVARDREGNCVSYPVVHTIQKDNICHTVRGRV